MTFNDQSFKIKLVNILIAIIPITYIIGNSLLNANILLLILFCILMFRFEILERKFHLIDKIVLILFTYIFFNGLYNNFYNTNLSETAEANLILKKTIFYFKFLFLYFVLTFLIEKKLIFFKFIFFSFGLCCLFVSIDIIIQYFFNKDLFGFEKSGRKLAGPFGDEYIAGSYIQRFFLFLPYSLLLFSNLDIKKKNFINFIVLIFCILGVVLAGNRMPLVLALLILTLLFFYEKSFRYLLFILAVIAVSGFSVLMKSDLGFNKNYNSFAMHGLRIIKYFDSKINNKEIGKTNVWIKEIESGILTWKKAKYFGGGIKSFYWNCSNIDREKMLKFVTKNGRVNCNSHPHNYYLHIISELGIFGLTIILFLFTSVVLKSLFVIHGSNPIYLKGLLVPFFIIFLIEIFPLKTSGSFFTTTNATFLFIIMSFIVGLVENAKKYDK